MDNLTIKRALSQAKAAGPVRVKEQLNAAGIMEMLKGNGLQDLASASAYLYIEAVMEKLSLLGQILILLH